MAELDSATASAGRTIAIGDVHGCLAALRSLLELVRPASNDWVVFLGDCVDRGPDSCGVVEEVIALSQRCRVTPLLGNHDEMLLNHVAGHRQRVAWLPFGGQETLNSYAGPGGAEKLARHVEYMQTWSDFAESDSHFFAHGAYDPALALGEQPWSQWRWHRIREGVPAPHYTGKHAVVGHTAQKNGEILDAGHLICIDTYCYGGGWLTAKEICGDGVWQVDRDGRPRVKTKPYASPAALHG